MTAFLLSVHVLAAILTIGPVAIAASMFPPAWRAAAQEPSNPRKAAVVTVLHRVTRVYATIGVLVPVFGLATGASLGVLGDAWLITSMVLTAGAAAILIALILPAQRRALAELDAAPAESVPAGGAAHAFVDSTAGDSASGDSASDTGASDASDGSAADRPPADAGVTRRLAMHTGLFNLLWAIVVVLMIYRPGSTTGV